jgi:uracil phosphoribosyltransferase
MESGAGAARSRTPAPSASSVPGVEGVRRLLDDHSDGQAFSGALDREPNDTGYIPPGLGDVGDPLFGTR